MIIRNKNGDIVKIQLVSGTEKIATFREVVEYFSNKFKEEKVIVKGNSPFLFGSEDRVIFGNLELKSTSELFYIYMKINSNFLKSKMLSKPPFNDKDHI